AVPYVGRIDMADYLPDNLAELQHWLSGRPESHSWNHFSELVLDLENSSADSAAIASREKSLRQKLGSVRQANVLDEYPLGRPEQYPAVGFFYCAEAAARTKQQWRKIMSNVGRIVEPGGYLFMASLRNASHYTVDQPNGHNEVIPTASV